MRRRRLRCLMFGHKWEYIFWPLGGSAMACKRCGENGWMVPKP